jgi:hypothetical protein
MINETNYKQYTCLHVDIYTITQDEFNSMLAFLEVMDKEKSWYFVGTDSLKAEMYFEYPVDANAFRLKFAL